MSSYVDHVNLPNWNSNTLGPRFFAQMHEYSSSPL